ncbi:hypothetical protein GGI20_005043 [Coemansia sp. BCRC 34301]|nr:hypothetical protein GGI20_005043 [Coemansia sp. BCRC 34301]
MAVDFTLDPNLDFDGTTTVDPDRDLDYPEYFPSNITIVPHNTITELDFKLGTGLNVIQYLYHTALSEVADDFFTFTGIKEDSVTLHYLGSGVEVDLESIVGHVANTARSHLSNRWVYHDSHGAIFSVILTYKAKAT